ncbi:Ig-like domain-containing protein [Pseudomonadota bacterium]
MSSRLPQQIATTFTLSALALGMGLKTAHALEINIVSMVFNGDYNAEGSIDFDTGTGSFNAVDPFFNAIWVANVQQVFTTPGNHVWGDPTGPTNNIPDDGIPYGNYTYPFTLQAGQVAAGTFFNWSGSFDIPVLAIFDCANPDNGCRAAGPDANGGVNMQTLPFPGQAPAFNGPVSGGNINPDTPPAPPPPPIVLAVDNPNLAVQTGVTANWSPTLLGTVATPTCSIVQAPAQGTATLQSDCSSGTFTTNVAGNDTFVYQVNSVGGNDTATVSVTASTGAAPPTANGDGVTTDVETAADIDILANDQASGAATLDPATVVITEAPTQGTIASINTTNGVVTYQPNLDYCGPDSFKYTVDDNTGSTSNEAPVTIGVNSGLAPCSPDNVIITGGSVDPGGDGRVSLSQLLSAGIPSDNGVTTTCGGGCFDFRVTGLTGPTVTLVLPLTEPIPVAPLMRKWNGSSWVNFVEGPNDSFGSAGRVDGLCPSVGYTTGLGVGNECIQTTISDGGPNDMDGVVNGEVLDPSGTGKQNIPGTTTSLGSESGCTIGDTDSDPRRSFDWALLLGFIGGLWFWRKRSL